MVLDSKHIYRTGLLALIFLLLVQAGWGQSRLDQVVSRIDARLSRASQSKGFSGVAFIGKGERVLLNKGYGWANPQKREPNNASKRFMIASVSKAFAAAAILQLQDRGLLHVDDPISKHLEDYPEGPGNSVTIHHLLSHTSGIPDYINDFPLEFKIRQFMGWTPSKDDLIAVFRDRPLNFYPGEDFRYSNSGYVLLAKIVENVSGQEFDEYLWENILAPLEMERSGLGDFNMIGNRAVAHKGTLAKFKTIRNFKFEWIYGMGEMYATASDLDKWLRAFQDSRLLSESSRERMFTPVRNNYAYGWHVNDIYGHQRFSHGGYLPGWNSYVFYYPEDSISIILLSNAEDVNPLSMGEDISRILYLNEIHLMEEFVGEKDYAGRYETSGKAMKNGGMPPIEGEILTVNEEYGQLEVRTPDGDRLFFSGSESGGWKEESERGMELAFRREAEKVFLEVIVDGQRWEWQKMRGE